MTSRALRPVALAVLALVLAGCGLLPLPGQAPAGPLLTVTSQGGRCIGGMCESVVVIEQDGRAHLVKPDVRELGRVPSELLQPLTTLINSTAFAALKGRPFVGLCPTAWDGQEQIYEFRTPSGIERIASCEVEVDPAHPLFRAVEAALGAVGV